MSTRRTNFGTFRPIGQVAAEVAWHVAVRAAAHWLRQADQMTGRDRIAALETTDAILRKAGLRRGDVSPREAA